MKRANDRGVTNRAQRSAKATEQIVQMEEVEKLIKAGTWIQAVRVYRQAKGCLLKEACAAVHNRRKELGLI